MNIEEQFQFLNVWKKGDERAPHKPLLILYALSKCINENQRLIPYRQIDQDLKKLLIEFGPYRKSYHPEFPYWHLQSDGLWKIDNLEQIDTSSFKTSVKKRVFLDTNSKGGFPEEVYQAFRNDRKLAIKVLETVLTAHFPESIHEDILAELGLDKEFLIINGIALCSLHHKLFDRGMFTLNDDLKVNVSEKANGNEQFEKWMLDYNGKLIRFPQRPSYYPEINFVEWHVKEVFHGPARYVKM